MMKQTITNTESQIIVNPQMVIASSLLNPHHNLTSMMIYGGVAVAVIISMTYFSQILIKSISELVKAINK